MHDRRRGQIYDTGLLLSAIAVLNIPIAPVQSIYAAISGLQLFAQLGNIVDNSRLCLRAAEKLHNGLLGSLLAAPMSFFHTTPVGRCVPRTC